MSNSESKWDIFWAGFIFGIAIAALLINLPIADHRKARDAIEECQKNLPRSQHCHITAEPDEPSISNSSN